MSSQRNRVQVIGRLGADPEIKEVSDSKKVAKLRIAVNEYFKKSDGTYSENTNWFNVSAWNNTAEMCEKNLKKGSEVVIEGKLSVRDYEDKEGIKKYVTEIVASNVLPLMKTAKSEKQEVNTVNEDLPF